MVIVKCKNPNCNNEFKVTQGQIDQGRGKYCSSKCYHSDRKIHYVTKPCAYCGEDYTVTIAKHNAGSKYCSKECSSKSQKTRVKCKCEWCGKEFETHLAKIKNGKGKFCSTTCYYKSKKGQLKPKIRVTVKCAYCGKTIERQPNEIKNRQKNYCSYECYHKDLPTRISGKNHPNWLNGISFEPYCPKFNNEFKERVRNFWNRKCGICGKPESENRRKLPVHHVNYEKMACCNNIPPLFMPLCDRCHSMTNFKRTYWESILTSYIMIYFDGESYLLK